MPPLCVLSVVIGLTPSGLDWPHHWLGVYAQAPCPFPEAGPGQSAAVHAERDAAGPLAVPEIAALAPVSRIGRWAGGAARQAAVQAADLTPDPLVEAPARRRQYHRGRVTDVKDSIADLFRGAKMICVVVAGDVRFF